jgi:hypothetical protein
MFYNYDLLSEYGVLIQLEYATPRKLFFSHSKGSAID